MNNFQKLCDEISIPAAKVATYCGFDKGTIARVLRGAAPMKEAYIKKITSLFNVTSDYLLGKSDYGYIVYYKNIELIFTEEEYLQAVEDEKIDLLLVDKSLDIPASFKKKNPSKFYVYREYLGSLYEVNSVKKDMILEKINELSSDQLDRIIKIIEEKKWQQKRTQLR